MTAIGNWAFQNCLGLTELALPAALTTIGVGAFSGCTSLCERRLPIGLTTIGNGAFQNCTSLTELSLPAALTTIGSGAFRGATSLTTLTRIRVVSLKVKLIVKVVSATSYRPWRRATLLAPRPRWKPNDLPATQAPIGSMLHWHALAARSTTSTPRVRQCCSSLTQRCSSATE